MSAPQPSIRVVVPRCGPDGRTRFVEDLAVATTVAEWVAAGATVQLRCGHPSGTLSDWAGQLRRGAARLVVVAACQDDAVSAWVARGLEADLVTVAALSPLLARLLPEHHRSDGAGYPYQHGVLPAEAATTTGVDASSAGVLGDLARIGRDLTQPAPRAVPVINLPLGAHRRDAGHRSALVGAARAHGLTPVPVLTPQDLTPHTAAALRRVGVTRVRLDASAGDAWAVRSAQAVASSVQLPLSVRVDLYAAGEPTTELARQVSDLVQVCPDADVLAPAPVLRRLASYAALSRVLPTSTLARSVRADSRRGRLARERLVEGRYPNVPLVGGPHDLWWDHQDHPADHEAWLSATIPMGGHLHLSAAHDTARWTAPVPLSDYRDITPYSDLAPQDHARLAVLASADCVASFLADAASAWHTGEVPARFVGASLAGLCAVSGPCWSAGGRRLYVDRHGSVCTRPGGAVVGQVGQPFAQIRRQLRAGGARCCAHRADPAPWLHRALSARESLRAVRVRHGQAVASGFGGPLLHGFRSSTHWPPGLALLRAEDGFLVHHAEHGTTARLSRGQATCLETILDQGADAAAVLGRQGTDVARPDVTRMVAGLLARLSGTAADTPVRRRVLVPAAPRKDAR